MSSVMPVADLPAGALESLFAPAGLGVVWVPLADEIPGSYWGESEAGLIGARLYVRPDTPVHSALHEASHWLCVPAARQAQLHTDALSDDTEENAVCLLQCLLADGLPGYSQARACADMDAWGYHFLLGSTAAWLSGDTEDAWQWLATREPALYPGLMAVIQPLDSVQARFRYLWQNGYVDWRSPQAQSSR